MPYTHITEVEFNCLKVSIEPKCINQSLNVTNVSMLNALRTFEKKMYFLYIYNCWSKKKH